MPRRPSNRPTDAELEILSVLWELGPSTVRQVQEELARRGTGSSSTLKLMQIMTDKGVLVRDEDVRPQVYQVAKSRSSTQRQLVSDLLQRAFGGAADKLVLAALSSQRTTPEERAAIQALLDDHARDEGDALAGDDSDTDADTAGHDEEDRT